MKRSHRVSDAMKRLADVVVSAIALVVLSPVITAVALVVLLSLGRPVIFRQPRAGKNGQIFTLYKFRTMREAPTGTGALDAVASDDARLTPPGRTLRATSLDELPQLANVLLGHMSLVGPRPLLPEYLPRYNREQARRHEVRPGITGWAQVNGRNALTWDERFALDVWYVDHRSLLLDARIVLRTLGAVVSGRGVSGAGSATMTPFEGDAQTAGKES